MRRRVAVVVFAVAIIWGCVDPVRVPSIQAEVEAAAARKDSATFFVIGDTHVGHDVTAPIHEELLAAIHKLPGRPAPAALGGVVDTPVAVIHLGDATELGTAGQWKQFETLYGSDGTDGPLRYPLLLTEGNHDRYLGRSVDAAIRYRHGQLYYSWTCHGVHFVNLGLSPEAEGLAWLAEDLAAVPATMPILVLFHRTAVGYLDGDWSDAEKDAFVAAMKGRNVRGILTGHWHRPGATPWRGFMTARPGGIKHGSRTMLVVRVKNGTAEVWLYDWDNPPRRGRRWFPLIRKKAR